MLSKYMNSVISYLNNTAFKYSSNHKPMLSNSMVESWSADQKSKKNAAYLWAQTKLKKTLIFIMILFFFMLLILRLPPLSKSIVLELY